MNQRVTITSKAHFRGYGRLRPWGRIYTVTINDAEILARAPFGRLADGTPVGYSQCGTLAQARALVKRATKKEA